MSMNRAVEIKGLFKKVEIIEHGVDVAQQVDERPSIDELTEMMERFERTFYGGEEK